MLSFEILAVLAFGFIFGSFLNALLFRYNTGKSALRGRSRCMHCGHTLGAQDLIPLLSYLYLRGRCRYCRSCISWQYPAVEALAAALALGVYLTESDPLRMGLAFGIFYILLFIVMYDLRHQIIPWSASFTLGGLAALWVIVTGPTLEAFFAGPILATPLAFLSLISKGRWMGWGDAPLQLSLGWFLGLSMGFSALVLSFWIGALVGITLIGVSRAYTMRSEVPFAPFLVLGAASAYFLHVDLLQVLKALLY